MKKINNIFKIIACIFMIGLGITAISFGNECYYSGTYVEKIEYGGEAYTGIQNAAASTANNTANIGRVIEKFSYYSLHLIGIGLISFGVLFLTLHIIEFIKDKSPKVSIPQKIEEPKSITAQAVEKPQNELKAE